MSGNFRKCTQAPGLLQACEKLQYMMMSKAEQQYGRHVDAIVVQNDVISTAQKEGRAEGLKEGREEGKKEGIKEGFEKGCAEATLAIARQLKALGMPPSSIVQATGVSEEDVRAL